MSGGEALGTLRHRCELVRAALAGDPFEAAMDDAATGGFEELARLLRTLEELKAAAGTAASLVNALMAEVAVTDLEVIDGLATFERKPGTTRKTWDHAAVTADVYAWALDPEHRTDPDTGEVTDPAEAVRDAFVSAGHFDYWRVRELKAMGLNPDLYCEKTPGAPHLIARWVEPLELELEEAPAIVRRGPNEEAAA